MAKLRLCSIPDCGKPVGTRGWCSMHYARWARNGDPLHGRSYASSDHREAQSAGLTAELLRAAVNYNSLTGVFTWLPRVEDAGGVARWNGRWAGKAAGTPHIKGYLSVAIFGRHYLCHRLAWLYMTGEWPVGQIDHINGDKSDNRFENLREASPSQNQMNQGRHRNNKTGVKGVSWHKAAGKWVAQITANKQRIYLGLFVDKTDAENAYREAASRHHGEFAQY